jgi:hypothetical protein
MCRIEAVQPRLAERIGHTRAAITDPAQSENELAKIPMTIWNPDAFNDNQHKSNQM